MDYLSWGYRTGKGAVAAAGGAVSNAYDYCKEPAAKAYDYSKKTVQNIDPKTAAKVGVGVVAAVGAPVAIPALVNAVGFTAVGVKAGTWAASSMSLTWKLGYFQSVVSACQSVGVLGISGKATALVSGAAYWITDRVWPRGGPNNPSPPPAPQGMPAPPNEEGQQPV